MNYTFDIRATRGQEVWRGEHVPARRCTVRRAMQWWRREPWYVQELKTDRRILEQLRFTQPETRCKETLVRQRDS